MRLPDLSFESLLYKKGHKLIAGVDEVGRGSWAGPLVAAAAILPRNFQIPSVFGDSKQLKPKLREQIAIYIKKVAVTYFIAEIAVSVIDKLGVGEASHIAFRKAVRSLNPKPDFILVDAFYVKHLDRKNQKALVKGDEKSASIAAASIIAKVHRDNLMKKLTKTYPQYGFAKHKGYGTRRHQAAIKEYGLSKIHRTSYNLNCLFS